MYINKYNIFKSSDCDIQEFKIHKKSIFDALNTKRCAVDTI